MREFKAPRRANFSDKTCFKSAHARNAKTRAPAPTRSTALQAARIRSRGRPGRACSASADQDCRCAQGERNQSHRDQRRLPQHHRRRSASNATRPTPNAQQHQKHQTTNAGPPRRGQEPGNDAAQLRRDAAAAALPSSLNAGDAAVCQCAGHPSGDAHGESEKGKAEAPESRKEAPRPHPSSRQRAVAPQFTRFG